MEKEQIENLIELKLFKGRILKEVHQAHAQNIVQFKKDSKLQPERFQDEIQAEALKLLQTIKGLKKDLASDAYRNVLADLVAFTGFSGDEVCFRAAKKLSCGFGARGWFNEEFDFFSPRTPEEYAWYYRCSQVYVFTNSRKRWWGIINHLDASHEPILDYGAGIGQNILELNYRGIHNCWFFEIGAIQSNFFQFRMKRHNFEPQIIRPYYENKFDSINCIQDQYGAIVLQDILEHVPNYEKLLRHLCSKVRRDGIIIEHSPFATEQKLGGLYPHMHLKDVVGLHKIMIKAGMKLKRIFPQDGKAKSEIRIWRKT